MTEVAPGETTETRGGEKPDWDRARPGQPLPELPGGDDEPPAAAWYGRPGISPGAPGPPDDDDDCGVLDRDVVPLPAACALAGCGGD